ncbi:MAG: glycosyltransferase [Chloroflexi bacterium]|nr:glycosyltransferase [Chloroflexota bacterium]
METPQQMPGSRLVAGDTVSIVQAPDSAGVALDEALTAVWQHPEQSLPDSPIALALRRAGLLHPPLPLPADAHDAELSEERPLVSVVIVSRNGRHHLEECLPSLAVQTYPNLEIIVVNDCSSDGTDAFLQAEYPSVRRISQPDGPNFAAGNNVGIRQARGELLLLLNNDTVLDPHCIQEMVVVYQREENVGGVAGMLRFYDNRPFINGLGSRLRRFGFGHDVGIGSLDVGQFEHLSEVPLLCFGVALIPKAALADVGPLEEMYQFYYEDVDWSYRARALGYRLVPAPKAITYHKFSASTSKLSAAFKKRLATRNRLWFALKNFPLRSLPLQMVLYGLDDWGHLLAHLLRGDGDLAGAVLSGWGQYLTGAPHALTIRRRLWNGRSRQPVNLFNQTNLPLPAMHGSVPCMTKEMVETVYKPHLQQALERGRTVLIISPDSVHSSMGGVGIRYWELSHQLATVAQVTLAVPNETDLQSETVALCRYENGQTEPLQSLAQVADIILLSGFAFFHNPFLRELSAYRIVDLYDPMALENLERFADRPLGERMGLHQVNVNTFNDLFAQGDFFICASEKQRDYWLGALTAVNRVTPALYDEDPTLRRLIDLVPFGIPAEPPQHRKRVLKGVRPGIGAEDKVILWGGGLWDWLDPLTVIEAMPLALEQVPEARLFFLGIKHPNPNVPPSRMAERALTLAEKMGLLETAVFYNEWTPYEERESYLCEADVGVSLHGDHIETRFAVRTRLMDYLWARLPMVVSGGDVLSDLVQAYGLGQVVGVGEKTAVAEALIDMLRHPIPPPRFDPIVERHLWSETAVPLLEYVSAPWYNGRKDNNGMILPQGDGRSAIGRLSQKVMHSFSQKGIRGLINDTKSYLHWISQK